MLKKYDVFKKKVCVFRQGYILSVSLCALLKRKGKKKENEVNIAIVTMKEKENGINVNM